MKQLGGVVAPNTAEDAEMTALSHIYNRGWEPVAGAVSRPPCPFCANSLLDTGATMTGPMEA